MENKENFGYLSNNFLKDFKKWVKSEHDNSLITTNSFVRPNVDYKELAENADCPTQEHTMKEIVKSFIKNGGKVKEIIETSCLIKTKKGFFYLDKKFID